MGAGAAEKTKHGDGKSEEPPVVPPVDVSPALDCEFAQDPELLNAAPADELVELVIVDVLVCVPELEDEPESWPPHAVALTDARARNASGVTARMGYFHTHRR